MVTRNEKRLNAGTKRSRAGQSAASPTRHSDNRQSELVLVLVLHHLTAGFSAAPAGFGTAATVVMVVLLALFRADVTSNGTQATHFDDEVRVARHKAHTQAAGVSTVAAGTDALSHHRDRVAVQARISTIFAGTHASVTRANTGFNRRRIRRVGAIVLHRVIPYEMFCAENIPPSLTFRNTFAHQTHECRLRSASV